MCRTRTVGLLLVTVLLASACSGGESVLSDQQAVAEAPSIAETGLAEVPDESDPSAEDGVRPSGSGGDTGGSDSADDAGDSDEGRDVASAGAEALLAAAIAQLDGLPVRGEATLDLGQGFVLPSEFESDSDGDLAARIELSAGLDPFLVGGADSEFRYVGGVVYVRPPVAPQTLAGLGLDEAWYIAEPVEGSAPMTDAVGSPDRLLCVFLPQPIDQAPAGCDPLGAAVGLLAVARDAVHIGREDVRGVEASRVRFAVPLFDLVGEALGMASEEGGAGAFDEGLFDDSISDLSAAGLEVEAWIDDESRIRRLTFDLASLLASIADAGEPIPESRYTFEFFDFGASISVEAPPAEVIVDDPGLLGGVDFATSE